MRQYDFLNIELFKVIDRRQFSQLLRFLESHGGLDAMDEYQRTTLMELVM